MKKANMIMLVAAVLPLALFFLPLWEISLKAPQYPTPLGMYIHVNKFGDANPNDIQNINLMNHYVGMKPIPETIPEFTIFPVCILAVSILGLLIAFRGNHKWFLFWTFIMILFSTAGIYDFYIWEYNYGHDLDDKAIMKFTNPDGSIMGFQPPLLGTKQILNFTVHSYPALGGYIWFISLCASVASYWIGKKIYKKEMPAVIDTQRKGI